MEENHHQNLATGKTWRNYVTEKILCPLKMILLPEPIIKEDSVKKSQQQTEWSQHSILNEIVVVNSCLENMHRQSLLLTGNRMTHHHVEDLITMMTDPTEIEIEVIEIENEIEVIENEIEMMKEDGIILLDEGIAQ
jgi:hypothetical protein